MAILAEAKRNLTWAVAFAVAASLLGFASVVQPTREAPTDVVASFIAAVVGVASFVFFRIYESRYDLAAEAKRLALVEDGLGLPVPAALYTSVLSRAGRSARDRALRFLDAAASYYASTEPPGTRRLIEMVAESAFHTFHAFRTLRGVLVGILVLVAALAVLAAWFGLVAPASPEFRTGTATALALAVPAVLSLGLLNWIIRLGDLASSIERVYSAMEALAELSDPPVAEVSYLTSEYNCALAQGIVVPDFVWLRIRDQINSLWEAKLRAKNASPRSV
jgi:hypothetical protein